MKVTLSFPTDQEVEQTHRFRTYYNYVCAVGDYIDANEKVFLSDVTASDAFKNIQGGRSFAQNKLEKLIRNAWITEMQLNMTGRQKEFALYSNHWAPVQVYYSVYLMLRVLFVAMGKTDLGGEHASNLKAISEEIKRRPNLFPYPWKVLCEGDPSNPTYLNLPGETRISSISSLANYTKISIWDSVGLLLKTTRQRKLEKICDDWKHKEKRKRVNSDIKQRFTNNLSPTSFFHFLYRLRLRSNYEDADSFLLSLQSDDEADKFNQALRKINCNTLLMLELLIARYLNKKNYKAMAEGFLNNIKTANTDNALLNRCQIIDGAF